MVTIAMLLEGVAASFFYFFYFRDLFFFLWGGKIVTNNESLAVKSAGKKLKLCVGVFKKEGKKTVIWVKSKLTNKNIGPIWIFDYVGKSLQFGLLSELNQ